MILESDPTCLRLFPRRFLKKVTLLAQPEQVVLGRRVKAGPQFPPVLETFVFLQFPGACQYSSVESLGGNLALVASSLQVIFAAAGFALHLGSMVSIYSLDLVGLGTL